MKPNRKPWERRFTVRAVEREGIRRAAEWHDRFAAIFHDAAASRRQHGMAFGEMLSKAEDHEHNAQSLREFLKTKSQKAAERRQGKKALAKLNALLSSSEAAPTQS